MIIPKTELLETQIAKAKELLSENSRNAIDAVNWKQTIEGIGKSYNVEQLEVLKTETELLLCGLTSTFNFPKKLEDEMKISKTEISVLLNEMDRLIFKKMQEGLEKRIKKNEDKKIVYTNKPFVVDPRFISLPKEVQEAISYSDWKERMYDIAKKFKLNVEQTGFLEEITTKVILNTIHADQYENEIRSKIDLGDDKIKEMVAGLNENIFKNIKEIMENAPVSGGAEKKIPAPPYAKTIKNEELGIKNVEEKITEIKKEEIIPTPPQKEIEDIVSNNGVGKKEFDIYREHGIEIINNDQLPTTNEEIKKVTSNIVADKLFGNTTSKTTVSDYSLPKISRDQENIHDPYHEAI